MFIVNVFVLYFSVIYFYEVELITDENLKIIFNVWTKHVILRNY